MKQNMGQIGIVIAVVVAIALLIGGFMMFVKDPSKISPEETQKMMGGGQTHGKSK